MRVWLVVVLLAVSWFAPARAGACSCMARSTEDALKSAIAVFEGRVEQVEEIASADRSGQRVKLGVVRAWKGVDREQLEVSTPDNTCGVSFETGQSYLVFALPRKGEAGELVTNICAGTKPMSMAEGDLEVLGMGATPFEPRPRSRADENADESPARGGCASCAIGQDRRGPATRGWLLGGLLMACARVAGRRRLRSFRR